ncbi:uncharacterized protein HMPREF1541_01804 [Cyphellophora europaea CBS 101466]|uniref:Xylanolytic transcriptional activator regulatory domain-containing protein n=1 Tax=Cyphellophora europaea (strain CBS 101466) TaxID=1220924 RepID=W2S1T1_CYPE1|nr:uncharacterized protein HMPREF1541_01804 [Cyphellophora europaea CBS 101466]ETN42647.1 hypothetical protein HMPREF1541_01804 [Cyphellophora europaea CBS 101466]
MKYVIDEVGDPFRSTPQTRLWGDHLQLYMLERLGQPTREALWRLHYSNQQLLKTQGAFNSLGRRLGTDLVQSYFTYSYTHLPIFQRHDLITLHESGAGLSPLVANAVYFIGTLHCSSSTIDALGFGTRYMASTTFYRRAKALYDADCESDGLANVQAAILLSHWWGGPMDPKDTWHWLGIASGLAQSLGMHRSKSYACLQPHRRTLWRRIWWVLYINDIHHAAVFGRPPHIHPSFCDVGPLSHADFDDDDGSRPNESTIYLIYLAELAQRVAGCLFAKFLPDDRSAERASHYRKLHDFKQTLSSQCPISCSAISADKGFWPSMLHLYHCDYQIVFHRMLSDEDDSSTTFTAAGNVNRLLEDLLASGLLARAPFMTFPAIFASILVNIIHIRKGEAHIKTLAESRARFSMRVLADFEDAWPIVIWTRHLLERLLSTSSSEQGDEPWESAVQPQATRTSPRALRDANSRIRLHGPAGSPTERNQPQPSPIVADAGTETDFAAMPLMFPFDDLAEGAGLLGTELWNLDWHG